MGSDPEMEELDLAALVPRAGFVTATASELERVELLQAGDGVQHALFAFGCVVSGGVLALVAAWKPQWKVKMLRRSTQVAMDATSVLVVATLTWTSGHETKTKRWYQERPLIQPVASPPWFEFRTVRYVVDESKASGFARLEHTLDESFKSAQRRCFEGSGWATSQVDVLSGVHGANEVAVKAPTWFSMLWKKVRHPLYAFQALNGFLWLCQGYVVYPLILLPLSSLAILWEVSESVQKATKVHAKVLRHENPSRSVTVFRDMREKRVPAAALVVGDVVVVDRGVVPADIVLFSGHCIVDEAMLTGEAHPVTKHALALPDPSGAVTAALKTTHRQTVLLAGSKVLELGRNHDEPLTSPRGIVISVGLATSQGHIFRPILCPPPGNEGDSDSCRFLSLISCVALLMGIIRLFESKESSLWSALELVIVAVPAALPLVLTVGLGLARSRLDRQSDVACREAARLKMAGHIDCFCFDKTGTLSSDQLEFQGMDECSTLSQKKTLPLAFQGLQREVEVLSPPAIIGLACCHALTERSGQLQGYALEMDMFRATGYTLEPESSEPATLRGQFVALIASPVGKLFGLVARFPFDAIRRRSSVLVEDLDTGNRYAYVKGSPEAIQTICTATSIPRDYAARVHSYTHQGFYVVALAMKPVVSSPASMPQEAVEDACTLLGLLVFGNQLKPEAPYVVSALEEAGIDVRLLTGDDVFSTLHVARKLNLEMETSVLVLEALNQDEQKLVYADVDDVARDTDAMAWTPVDASSFLSLAEGSALALTGAALELLVTSSPSLEPFAKTLVARTRVFARMRPEQKTWIIETLKTRPGACVAMCGDGVNDGGALQAAHVGLAFSNETATAFLAPFTSRSLRLRDAIELVRQGRGALSTTYVVYRYLLLASVVHLTLVSLLHHQYSYLSRHQLLFDDLVVVLLVALLMARTPAAAQLSALSLHRRLPRTLYAVELLVSLGGQLVIFVGCLLIALAAAQARPWFCSAEKALALTQAAWKGHATDVPAPCYVFVPGTSTTLTAHSYENSVLWRFGHLQCWIAAITLNFKDTARASVVRTNRLFVVYGLLVLVLLLMQLLGDKDDDVEASETSTSSAVAKALKARGINVRLGARELPVGFAWSLFSLFLFDFGCVVCWELVVVGLVVPRFQTQRRKQAGKARTWFTWMEKQRLVSPFTHEHTDLLTKQGRETKSKRPSARTAHVLDSDDDEELDVLEIRPREMV